MDFSPMQKAILIGLIPMIDRENPDWLSKILVPIREYLSESTGCKTPETRMLFGLSMMRTYNHQLVVHDHFYFGRFESYGHQTVLFVPCKTWADLLSLVDNVRINGDSRAQWMYINCCSVLYPVILPVLSVNLDRVTVVGTQSKLIVSPQNQFDLPSPLSTYGLGIHSNEILYSWFLRHFGAQLSSQQ